MTSWESSLNKQLIAQNIFAETSRPLPIVTPQQQKADRMDVYLLIFALSCAVAALLIVAGWRL